MLSSGKPQRNLLYQEKRLKNSQILQALCLYSANSFFGVRAILSYEHRPKVESFFLILRAPLTAFLGLCPHIPE